MTENTRAQAGGEVGINGLWYKGGQFLPSTTLSKMARQTKVGSSGKQEIAPYKWEVAPKENMRSIYTLTKPGVASRWAQDKWQEELELVDDEKVLNHFKIDRDATRVLIDLWNGGERWIEVRNENS